MKVFILGSAIVVQCTFFLVFQDQYNRAEREMVHARFVAEEAAAASSQYVVAKSYGTGKRVFNQMEGEEAAATIIPKMLDLKTNLHPRQDSYWQGPVTYQMLFIDDSNTGFPHSYTNGSFSVVMTGPTVVVTIQLGKPRFTEFVAPNVSRTAAHAWKPHVK